MRVDYSQSNKVHTGDVGGAKKTDRSNAARPTSTPQTTSKSAPSQSGDAKAEISNRARDFARAKEVALAAPEVREDRVAELKKKSLKANTK